MKFDYIFYDNENYNIEGEEHDELVKVCDYFFLNGIRLNSGDIIHTDNTYEIEQLFFSIGGKTGLIQIRFK